MAKQEQSLADKIRQRLNDSAGKELAKSFDKDEDLLQVKNWIPLKPFFKLATGAVGAPCGHLLTLIGKPDSGKSTLAMEAMVSCQKIGGIVYLIDSEHKFSLQRFELMGGISKDVVIIQTDTLEEAWTGIETVLKEVQNLREEGVDAPMLLIWDSVAASVPERVLTGEAGDAHMSPDAKLNNQNIRRLRQSIKKTDLACIFINHFYMTVPKTMYEQSELVVKGGEELSFLSTLIIRTKQGAKIERTVNGEKQKIGRVTRFQVHKGHISGRVMDRDVYVVDKGILETEEELNDYKKTLRGEF